MVIVFKPKTRMKLVKKKKKKEKIVKQKKIDRPLATATAKAMAGPKTVSGVKEACHYKQGKQKAPFSSARH